MTLPTPVPVPEVPEVMLNVYFSNMKSMFVVSSTGNRMPFLGGRYATKNPGEIADLDAMSLIPNGFVFKKSELLQLSEAAMDPMNVLRERFRKEFEAERAAHLNPEQDFGESIQTRLKTASTASIQAVTVK